MALGRAPIVAVLLGGPTVLAFFSGGYFDRPRLWAAVVAWLLVLAAALVIPRPWPRTWPAWMASRGLAGLTGWTALSIGWAPMRDVAQADAQRLLLYLGVLIGGAAVLRRRAAVRWLEPGLAAGAFAAVVEGLSERVLPGALLSGPERRGPGSAVAAADVLERHGIAGRHRRDPVRSSCRRRQPSGARCASRRRRPPDARGRRLPPAVTRRGARRGCGPRARRSAPTHPAAVACPGHPARRGDAGSPHRGSARRRTHAQGRTSRRGSPRGW